MARRDDGQVAISGTGRLQNGTDVSFTLLGPQSSGPSDEVSISMNNGYFAAGTLRRSQQLESKVHVLSQVGNTLKIPR